MTVQWPATLPLPTVEGYGIRPGEAILRTEMEAGHPPGSASASPRCRPASPCAG